MKSPSYWAALALREEGRERVLRAAWWILMIEAAGYSFIRLMAGDRHYYHNPLEDWLAANLQEDGVWSWEKDPVISGLLSLAETSETHSFEGDWIFAGIGHGYAQEKNFRLAGVIWAFASAQFARAGLLELAYAMREVGPCRQLEPGEVPQYWLKSQLAARFQGPICLDFHTYQASVPKGDREIDWNLSQFLVAIATYQGEPEKVFSSRNVVLRDGVNYLSAFELGEKIAQKLGIVAYPHLIPDDIDIDETVE